MKKAKESNRGLKKILFAAGAGALALYLFDPDRGKARRTKVRDQIMGKLRRTEKKLGRTGRHLASDAEGLRQRVAHSSSGEKTYDDVTLAQKVSSELFVDPEIPKDRININVEDGVIVLRGEVDAPKDVKKIERLVKKIDGVEDVDNLLHLVGTPAPNKESARRA